MRVTPPCVAPTRPSALPMYVSAILPGRRCGFRPQKILRRVEEEKFGDLLARQAMRDAALGYCFKQI